MTELTSTVLCMAKLTPFLTLSVSDLDFELKVVQDPHGMFGGTREHHFSPKTTPQTLHCRNARCQQGGFELVKFVYFAADGVTENTYYCDGHEGTPKGRRVGDPCGNSFVVRLEKRASPVAG